VKRIIGLLAACLVPAAPAFSQEQVKRVLDYETFQLSRVVTAGRIREEITLDGRLDEPAWKLAVPATDLIQQLPRPGELSAERTEARFLYDDNNLYVGVIAFDSDTAHMTINGLQKDFNFMESDSIGLILDSLHDRQSGFSFQTNPAGAMRDQQISNNATSNVNWDGVWDVKTSRNDEGWIAEYMIPFKTLRFSKSPSQEWGVNISRRVLRISEISQWAPIPPRFTGFRVSLAGTLRGLEGIRQGRNLTVKPFVTAGVTQARRADGRLQTLQRLDRLKDQDVGVDVKYSLTPELTLDGTFHTDFAQVEVDQQQVNLTRFNLFFPEKRDFFLENSGTFSFGPGGNLVPFFSRRIGLSAAGTPIPIVGGARVSGRINQYDVGFLEMQTEQQGATPSSNYLVGRLKRRFSGTAWIGGLLTNRDSSVSDDANRVYGTDAHFEFFERLEFDSFLLRSDTPGRTGNDLARRFQSAWKDEELTINAEYNSVQPNFNPEVGFVRRPNVEQYAGDLAWMPQFNNNDTIRNLTFGTSIDYYEGSASRRLETRVQSGNAGITFDNGASSTFTVEQTFDRLQNPLRIPAGNPRVAIPAGDYAYLSKSARFSTNTSRKITGNGTLSWGDFYNGGRKAIVGGMTVKPGYHLILNLTYDRNQVAVPNGSFTTDLVRTRFTYAFTPRSVVNAFIQYNADTHQVSSNIRFNWTHHPLSDLYIVYNDTRDTITGLSRERSFLIKVTNLFSF
jgi:hypothetical protein